MKSADNLSNEIVVSSYIGLWYKISQSRLSGLALFMRSLDYCKIAYFQYDFCKESSKINTYSPSKNAYFTIFYTHMSAKNGLIYVVFSPVSLKIIKNNIYISDSLRIIPNSYSAVVNSTTCSDTSFTGNIIRNRLS